MITNKIEAIKQVRLLATTGTTTLIQDEIDKGKFTLSIGYPGLRDTKDLVEAIMEYAVQNYLANGAATPPASIPLFSAQTNTGYKSWGTLVEALRAAESDLTIHAIRYSDGKGNDHSFYRNTRNGSFEVYSY